MEIINENPEPQQPSASTNKGNMRQIGTKIYFGVILIILGILWLCDNFDLIGSNIWDVIFSWQMLITIIGGFLLSLKQWAWGGIITAIGASLLIIEEFHIDISIGKIILPLCVIAAGLALLFTAAEYRKSK